MLNITPFRISKGPTNMSCEPAPNGGGRNGCSTLIYDVSIQ